jgi:hypothetical protein
LTPVSGEIQLGQDTRPMPVLPRPLQHCSGRWAAALVRVLLLVLAAPPPSAAARPLAPEPAQRIAIAPARWQQPGLQVEVEMGTDARVAADQVLSLALYAVGVVAMPLAAIDPAVALAWPIFILLGPPWQAMFNARRETLAQAFAESPLKDLTLAALRAQWPAADDAPARSVRSVRLRISAYGLVTRSGKALDAFAAPEDLCLSADAELLLARDGSPPTTPACCGKASASWPKCWLPWCRTGSRPGGDAPPAHPADGLAGRGAGNPAGRLCALADQ